MLWRIADEGVLSMYDMETRMSVDDVMRASAFLDSKMYYEKLKQEEDNKQ